MRRTTWAVLIAPLLMTLAGCSDDSAPAPRTTARASFESNPYGERVYEAYRQTGSRTVTVTLPRDGRAVAISMDCAGSGGRLDVSLTTAGSAGIDCKDAPGFVALDRDGSLLDRTQTITITGPGDGQWSVAVDAGARVTAN